MRTIYFYSGVGGFFVGVACVLMGLPALSGGLLALIIATALLAILCLGFDASKFFTAVVILLTALGLGAIRASSVNTADSTYEFASVVNENITATGTVVSRPTQTDSGQSFTVKINRLHTVDTKEKVSGSVKSVVYAGRFPQVAYGDQVRLSGHIKKPEAFTGTGGREFYYPQYLARKDIFYELNKPHVEKLKDDQGSWLQQSLANLRARLLGEIHEHIPDPHAALTGGVLLGAEDALGESLQEDFRQTSLIHIVVLSGFNVMIVAAAIGQSLLALGLPLTISAAVAVVGIILFALLVGLTPTVVRASIMAVFALLARVSGRRYGPTRGLSLAALGMVLVSPEILLYDPSFQLSAIATAGLIGFGDQVSAWLTWLPERFGLREAATATLSAQIAVLPLLLYYTGMLSFVSLPANLLVLPVVPILMAAGCVTIVLGFISSSLTVLGTSSVYVIAEYIFGIVRWLSDLSFATTTLPAIPVSLIIVIYVCLGGYAYMQQDSEEVIESLPEPKI